MTIIALLLAGIVLLLVLIWLELEEMAATLGVLILLGAGASWQFEWISRMALIGVGGLIALALVAFIVHRLTRRDRPPGKSDLSGPGDGI